ncbi:GNAT family N-acetyltransferase [Streptomyces sp. NPDC089919]|uniref:GNAT family N-acetyltransferase n=1 Tax=Streptomyces sp. NPDC089919 TaxID=3155188 RepID=UPI00344148A1
MDHIIRAVRADEWEKAKELRLVALRDPLARLAFHETYETALEQPDSFWQERTERAAESATVRQFIAEAPDGSWVGSVTVLVEPAGVPSLLGDSVPEQDQAMIVGVFVRAENRGSGLTEALFEAAVGWSWELAEPVVRRVRLYVHEDNHPAVGFYRRFGFEPTGVTLPAPTNPDERELEHALTR